MKSSSGKRVATEGRDQWPKWQRHLAADGKQLEASAPMVQRQDAAATLYGAPMTMLGSSVPLSILLAQTCIGWLESTRM